MNFKTYFNMNAKFKFRILTGVMLVATLCFATACNDDWNEHYSDSGVNTGETLKEIIEKEEDLSDFCEVLNACNCLDSLLDKTRVYTLFAPVNGSFDKDALLDDVKAGNRDDVFKRFVCGHLTNYLHPANGVLADDNRIMLLNSKVVSFVGRDKKYKFGDVMLDGENYNIRACNGILHKLNGGYRYMPNLWEYIAQDERISQLSNFLYSYYKKDTLWNLSIEGPVVNGEATYLDTVYGYSNPWFDNTPGRENGGFGNIDCEDSLYIMVAPTNDIWDEMVAKTRTYYNYEKFDTATADEWLKLDSLQECYSQRMLCNYLVFNKNEQKEASDELLSTFSYFDKGEYARRRFSKSAVMSNLVESVSLSNGEMYVVDNYPFTTYEIFHDTIIVEAETAKYEYNKSYSNAPTVNYVKDGEMNEDIVGEVSNEGYLAVRPKTSSSKPSATFSIPNTLSGSYYISAVFVPKNIKDQNMDEDEIISCRMNISLIKEHMLNNKKQTTVLYQTTGGVFTNPNVIDTLTLYNEEDNIGGDYETRGAPKKFKFDFCEFGKDLEHTTIKLQITAFPDDWDPELYERGFNLDCIILQPVENDIVEDGGSDSDGTVGDDE